MGLKYLGGKSWNEVTRDERFFCQHLYNRILSGPDRRNLEGFIKFINRHNADLHLDVNANWELAYELCFYRDLWHLNGKKEPLFSQKRTFDLALLSDDTIVVIEAKAQQGFSSDQVGNFELDRAQLEKETGARVLLIAICSSECYVEGAIKEKFDGEPIYWRDLSAHFDNDTVLSRANTIYEVPKLNYGANNLGGHLSGLELIAAHDTGARFFVGRQGGLRGALLAEDIRSGSWKTKKYETNQDVRPNTNWFSLDDFVERARNASTPGPT